MKYFDKIYIINSSRYSPNRRLKIVNELKSVGWNNYEFVEAIWGTELPADLTSLIKAGELNDVMYDPNGIMTRNIIACAMSHRRAQQKMINDGIESALIIEDDVKFTEPGLKMLVNGELDSIQQELQKSDWDLFYWGGVTEQVNNFDIGKGSLRKYKRYLPEWAAHAYQITRSGAEKLVKNNTPIKYAADVNLECTPLNMYCSPYTMICQTIGDWDRPLGELMLNEIHDLIMERRHETGSTEAWSNTITMNNDNNHEEAYATQDPSVIFKYPQFRTRCEASLPIESISWPPFVNERGDTLEYWANIRFFSNI